METSQNINFGYSIFIGTFLNISIKIFVNTEKTRPYTDRDRKSNIYSGILQITKRINAMNVCYIGTLHTKKYLYLI